MNTQTIGVIALVVVTFGIGVLVGNLTAGENTSMDAMSESIKRAGENVTGGGDQTTDYTSDSVDGDAVAFTMSIDSLSDAQKTMLRSMGIDSNEIQVTNNMVACAEVKIGSQRLTEIQNGASPSMSEGVALMGCYTAG